GFDPKVLYYHRVERPTKYGRSMWTFAKKIKYFADSCVAFSYAPMRAASLLGIGLSNIGLLYAAGMVIFRLCFDVPVQGWTSLMVVLLVVSGVQLLMMGFLGEYLWRNLEETRRRPRFVIERTLENVKSSETNPERQEADKAA